MLNNPLFKREIISYEILKQNDNMVYLYYEILFGNLKNEVPKHVTWMDFQNIMLSETSQL